MKCANPISPLNSTGRLRPLVLLLALGLTACASNAPAPGAGHLRPQAAAQGQPPALVDAPLLPPPPSTARAKADVFSVSVHNVDIRSLLFAIARDARLNLDVHPDLAGTVSMNAIDQTLPEILDRAARQVNMRYEMEGRNLFVMPDAPVLRHYRVDYLNVAREARSEIGASTSIARGGSGGGAGNSSSIVPGGGNDLSKVHGQVRRSESEDNANRRSSQAMGRAEESARDAQRLHALKAKVDSMIANNARLNEYRSQIRTEITHDGLMIQIVDDQNRPMFDSGSAVVKPYMRDILREIGAAMGNAENRISLSGHTDAAPYGNADRGYSNWELSADRANATRRELVAAGMPDAKLARVVGLAASDPLEPDHPRAPLNRRITITVLTHEAEERLLSKNKREVPIEQLLPEKQDNPAPEKQP